MRFEMGPVLAMVAALSGSDARVATPAPDAARSVTLDLHAPAPAARGLSGNAAILPGPFRVEALEAIDGDTVEARVTIWIGQQVFTRVRLRGIDAPELSSSCAQERRQAQAAREALAQILAKGADLYDVGRDKYGGRVLAGLRTPDGRDVAAQMLASGQVRAYAGGRRMAWCDVLSARR